MTQARGHQDIVKRDPRVGFSFLVFAKIMQCTEYSKRWLSKSYFCCSESNIYISRSFLFLALNTTLNTSALGFSKPFLRWLNSYLSDRSHFVQIDDRTSESVNVRFGVPQGSILGPMLFNLYVSDLQDHLPSSIGSFQYADDTTIYSSCPAPELQRCVQELNSTINTVSSWSNNSHLALNSKKTKTMLLSTSQMSHVHSLFLLFFLLFIFIIFLIYYLS